MPSYYAPEISAVPLNWGEYVQQEVNKGREAAKRYIDGVAKQLREEGITSIESQVLVGKAGDEISNYVNKNPFTMVVMATHGRSGLSRWVYGSVAESVLLGVPKPLFLVRAS
jgi:nucleotide-binding universal stress UspA family protein